MDLTLEDALRLIAARCPSIASEAIKSIRATGRTRQMRYDWLVEQALRDPEAAWTAEERGALVALVSDGYEPPLARTVAARVTTEEHERITQEAEAAGQTVSEYVRMRLAL